LRKNIFVALTSVIGKWHENLAGDLFLKFKHVTQQTAFIQLNKAVEFKNATRFERSGAEGKFF